MIIAELSANHGQNKTIALQLIDAAAEAGADAVKVQTYTPDTITFRSNKDPFIIKDQPLWKGQNLWDLYQKAYTPWDWQPELKQRAESLGLTFIASVFDPTSVDFWEQHDLAIYKIASAELIDIPLLKRVAATGKPIIISTGMATEPEIDEAVDTIRAVNPSVDLTLLKCSSAYPAPATDMNLAGIQTLIQRYNAKSGLSDHSLSNNAAIVSVGLGGLVFEKHLKLENAPPTPDDAFSLTPTQFKDWVTTIQQAQMSLGSAQLQPNISEQVTLPFRKSLFVTATMSKGEVFTKKNLRSIRPANGLHPRYYEKILGKKASCDIEAGEPLQPDMINGGV